MEVPVSPAVYRAISSINVAKLLEFEDEEMRPILPCLVRMSLITPLDQSISCHHARTKVLQLLSRCDTVNSIVALLSVDFHKLEVDVKKEQQLRLKIGGAASTESVLIKNLQSGSSHEFERIDPLRKLRLVLSELISLMHSGASQPGPKHSELFDHLLYLPELCEVVAIALAELPVLLQPPEVCEALLRLKYGPEMICHVVANQSDSFLSVLTHLIEQGDKGEEEGSWAGQVRQRALLMLAKMNPSSVLTMRAMCVEKCKMPGLALLLALEHSHHNPAHSDLVSWMTGLILGPDQPTKSWLSFWIRNASKKKCPALTMFRQELCQRVSAILDTSHGDYLDVTRVRDSVALLRLFTALRGIAGMKFTEEEIKLLLSLITRKPPPTKLGVRFAATGLCMLIACNSLLSQPGQERTASGWIRWLVSWGDCPSQMLLLTAIHFHAGQLSQVAELVCQTVNIKMSVRTNSMAVIKRIFTQEIFTESVVAQHAIKVPVTENLSSGNTGYLPVHCIHQLLKSRVFSKHRVNIKPWIYRQLLSCQAPLHPVLPSLIEAYVSSVLTVASSRAASECHNEPLAESEIRSVFSAPLFSPDNVNGPVSSSGYVTQLCILYYILLYEDTRVSQGQGRQNQPHVVKPHKYSQQLLNDIPIKFLLGKAESYQGQFEGLFASLERLASSQYPHLCLIEDWLVSDVRSQTPMLDTSAIDRPETSLASVVTCPAATNLYLLHLLSLPPRLVWSHAPALVASLTTVLDDRVPRHTRELFKRVWLRLNSLYPRKLWLMTVNSLSELPPLSAEELAVDPLAVLRCDMRVFRSGPILQILLYMMKACLAASRVRLSQYCTEQQLLNTGVQDTEREELKNSLILTQESAVIQILLESCQETDQESQLRSRLTDVQEAQSAVCCYLHQAFIEDTSLSLAKLVHFQGYPHELLKVTAAGVPSLFICLDTSPELLSQPNIDKQVFAVDLISHLSVTWALPKSLSYAKLAVNTLYTLLGVLASDERLELVHTVLPALVRICGAFPPLTEDCLQLLVMALNMFSTSHNISKARVDNSKEFTEHVIHTFQEILKRTVKTRQIF